MTAAALSLTVSGGAYAAVRVAAGNDGSGVPGAAATLGAEAQPLADDAGAGLVVSGTGVQVSTVTEEVTEARGTVEKQSADLPEGETRVETEGADGVVRTTYQVTAVEGREVARQPVSAVVVSEKQDKVVVVGTGPAPQEDGAAGASEAATGSSAPGSAGAAGGDSGSGEGGSGAGAASSDADSDQVWAALAQCESGGDPTANTGNGYYGLYQFSLSTWQAYGGTGLPSEASAAEQTAVAKRLQAAAGWGQWPHCAAQLGLL